MTKHYTRSQAVARIADRTASQQLTTVAKQRLQLFSRYCTKRGGITSLTFRVTCRDHLIPHRPSLIGGPLEPSLYL